MLTLELGVDDSVNEDDDDEDVVVCSSLAGILFHHPSTFLTVVVVTVGLEVEEEVVWNALAEALRKSFRYSYCRRRCR